MLNFILLLNHQCISVIENNPYVDKFYTIKDSLSEVIPQLKKENYDYVIDLHHNIQF